MLPNDFTPAHTHTEHIHAEDIVIALHGNTLLCDQSGLASMAHIARLPSADYQLIIGHYQGRAVHLLYWRELALPDTLKALELRASHALIGEELWLLAGRASQIATFYHTHRFCGVCGASTRPLAHEAACECSSCGHRVWPRISPAVMVLIRRGNEILLARSPHFRAGMYSAVAGYVEPGESLEQCAHREVLEEVGVRIKNLHWFGSQSWAFPHSLMLAFIADYESGEIVCQEGEIEDARWFDLTALPDLPSSYSVAWRLIDAVRRGEAV
ncbi:NAD(+) diphosphatase [Chitinibacter sp. GC72]|uniref:NAD(+) diphosphatase n=1 Tax=Chitinibacter sp. GC72 TaxID=1526917 RepID=UPI0012F85E2D|nr:NAD(+) diphosphatase [Chitinibacter sp. GC72]